MKARFVQIVNYGVALQKCWGDNVCPQDPSKCHRAVLSLATTSNREEADKLYRLHTDDETHQKDPKLQVCSWCGAAAPEEKASGMIRSIYDTASERPEPGDLYWADWYRCQERGYCIYGWTNCDGRHLMSILPNGYHWDIDSRASNCTMREDKIHRCWVRHGEPPNIHVDKSGLTCAAGAGSIAVPGYHGFLHNGHFT